MIIQPFLVYDENVLLESKQILLSKDNKPYRHSIFPKSTKISTITNYDSEHIISQIDDLFFKDFIILQKLNQTIYFDNNTKREYIKSIEYGDFNNSVKRYSNINIPLQINENAKTFLNTKQFDFNQINELNIEKKTIYNTNVLDELIIDKPIDNINHPHISPLMQKKPYFFNDKNTIVEIFSWAKNMGIKYIYCIVENRPNIISQKYTTPYVYYTIKGY